MVKKMESLTRSSFISYQVFMRNWEDLQPNNEKVIEIGYQDVTI
ncbi:hypothetical protein [Lysinibacillus sphaericus]|nr:hypothetical protein [Lysinibacillus sphaericus]